MGTSLSGLTPATTFDGLLKTSDNDAITSSLKTIGSGDGTDSCLQLSDSALKVNSGSVTIVGAGNTGATTSLLIEDSSAGRLLRVNDSGEIRMQTLDFLGNKITSLARINTSGLAINNAGTSPDANTQLHIKGSGATSATTSLLVQNSAGSDMLKVQDDGKLSVSSSVAGNVSSVFENTSSTGFGIDLKAGNGTGYYTLQWRNYVGGGSNGGRIYPNGVIIGAQSVPSARLHVKGSGNDSTTTSLLVENSDGNDMLKILDDKSIETYDATGNVIAKNNAGNRRFEINPNLNTLVDFQVGGGSLSNLIRTDSGLNSVGIGTTGLANTRFFVKGSGATSATTSLLVQNSANNIFSVRDDGALLFYRATNGAELLRIEDTGSSPRFVAGNNAGKSLTLGNDTITSAFSSIQFKTHDGTSYTEAMRITGNTDQLVGIGETSPSARLHVKGSGATSATTSLLVQNSSGTEHLKITDDGIINARQSINVNHITNSSRSLRLSWGSIYATDNNSELNVGAVYSQPTAPRIILGGKTRSGGADAVLVQALNGMYLSTTASTENPSAQLHVKGAGATSATTALLVENSSGTDTLEVRDDGQINFNGNIYANADYKSVGRNSLNSIRFAGGETRVAVQGTSSANKFHVYASSTATSVFSVFTQTQQVGIGNGSTALESTAKLQVDSTTQGFLPPRMTGTQRDAIEEPASGLIIYNTTTNKAQCYNGTSWNDMF